MKKHIRQVLIFLVIIVIYIALDLYVKRVYVIPIADLTAINPYISAFMIMAIFSAIVYFIYLFIKYEKDELVPLAMVDDFELFDKYNPIIAGCILEDRDLEPKDIVATLLNLVNKKVLKIEITKQIDDSYIYELSKNQDVLLTGLDDIEIYIYDYFFSENINNIELLTSLKEFKKSDNFFYTIYKLQEMVDSKLKEMGARKKNVSDKTRLINNWIFAIVCIIVFFHIIYVGIFVNPMEITKPQIEHTNNLSNILYGVNILVVLALPIILVIMLYVTRYLIYLKNGINNVIKLPTNNLGKFMMYYGILAVVFILVDIFLLKDTSYTLDVLLVIVTGAIMFSDNLMSKHDRNILKEASKLNVLKNKLEHSLLNERDVEQIVLWDRYLTYAISLGVSKKILNRIPSKEIVGIISLDIMQDNIVSNMGSYYSQLFGMKKY